MCFNPTNRDVTAENNNAEVEFEDDDDGFEIEEVNEDRIRRLQEEVERISDDDEFEASSITGVRVRDGRLEFEVMWKVNDAKTWEPQNHFVGEDSLRMLDLFMVQNGERIRQLVQESIENAIQNN